MKKYTVKILNDRDFDNLPYPEMSESLGVADPRTNTAYIRNTHIDEANKYLINHEVEHLIEKKGGVHSDHYKHGVYYKKSSAILQPLAVVASSLIPGIGPYVAPAVGSLFQSKAAEKAQRKESGIGRNIPPPQMQPSGPHGSSFSGFSASNAITPSQATSLVPGGLGGGTGALSSFNTQVGQRFGSNIAQRLRGFFAGRRPLGGIVE